MRFSALLFAEMAMAYTCSIYLNGEDPPLTAATLEAALQNRIQGCPDPQRVDLSNNDLEFIPETFKYINLGGWDCTGTPLIRQNLTLESCQSLCTNTSECSFVRVKQTDCALYSHSCLAASNTSAAVYRKDSFMVGMEDFMQISSLQLSGNRLTSLPQSLRRFRGLTKLELDNNLFTTFPDDAFANLTYLETLNLEHNGITSLSRALFKPLEELTSLEINHNLLISFSEDVFADLIYVKFLNFESNNVTALPTSLFSSMTKLTSLDFDNNRVTTLASGVFDGLSELVDLSMNMNPLTSLPNALFRNATQLRSLQMTRNQLSSLPPDIFLGAPNLSTLSLTRTGISALPPDVFSGLKLTTLELDKPPECSAVRPCSGRVQVGRVNRTFVTTPTAAPTTAAPTATTPNPTQLPTAPTQTTKFVDATKPTQGPTKPNNATPAIFPMVKFPQRNADVEVPVSGGAVAGIVLGALACLCLCCLLFFCARRHAYNTTKEGPQITPGSPSLPSPYYNTQFATSEPAETGALLTDSVKITTPATPGYDSPMSTKMSYNSFPANPAVACPIFVKGAKHYTVVRSLGKGHFGTAFLVTDPQSNLLVVKTLTEQDQNTALKEARTLALNTPTSPHLLKILDFFFEGDQFCIVLNYCGGGSLQELVPQKLDFGEVERILREIAAGLECLHSKDLIHRDLKPDNIFLLDAESRTVVIGDMGMARLLNEDGFYNSHFGHMLYKAPEIEKGQYSPRSDMWAVGCIGLELLSGEALPTCYSRTKLALGRTTPAELASLLGSLPPDCKQHTSFKMISSLLVHDPFTRLTAQQLKAFPSQQKAPLTRFDYE